MNDVTVVDRLPAGNGDGNVSVDSPSGAYYIKVKLSDSLKGQYELRIEASRADAPDAGELNLLLGFVGIYEMQSDDLGEFHMGQPAWVDLSDAQALIERSSLTPKWRFAAVRNLRHTVRLDNSHVLRCSAAAPAEGPSLRIP